MSKKLSHVFLIGIGLFSSTWVMAAVKEYDLTIAEQTVNITGKPLKRITVNVSLLHLFLSLRKVMMLLFVYITS